MSLPDALLVRIDWGVLYTLVARGGILRYIEVQNGILRQVEVQGGSFALH